MEKLSKKDYLDSFIQNIEPELNKNLTILYKSFPAMSFNIKNMYYNQKLIQSALSPYNPLICYINQMNPNQLELSIGNNQVFPIEVLGISLNETQVIVVNSTPDSPMLDEDATYCSNTLPESIQATGSTGTYTWYSDESLNDEIPKDLKNIFMQVLVDPSNKNSTATISQFVQALIHHK